MYQILIGFKSAMEEYTLKGRKTSILQGFLFVFLLMGLKTTIHMPGVG